MDLNEKKLLDNNVLLSSHQKTGSHWVLFIVANYHNVLVNNAKESFDWNFVYQYSVPRERDKFRLPASQQSYIKDFPRIFKLEYPRSYSMKIRDFFDSFDYVIYLHRHPADVMISRFYFMPKQLEDLELVKKMDLKTSEYFEDYVKFNLPNYLVHIEDSMSYADIVLCYDKLREDPSNFRKVLRLFYDNINEDAFQRALELSSFNHVKSISEETRHKRHTRDGRSGQYNEFMSTNLIEYIKNECKKRGLKKLWDWK